MALCRETCIYLLYIDDSGTKEFTDKDVNLFCYAGVLFKRNNFELIDGAINNLKKAYFDGQPQI
jgi:hypothetical protein